MQNVTWRLVLLVAVGCSLPGCDFDPLKDFSPDWSLTREGTPESCAEAGLWLALQGPQPIEVGASVPIMLMGPLFISGCTEFLTSLKWKTSVPGVVGIRPGEWVHQAILTGRGPGETHIVAEFTLVGDHAGTAGLLDNETVTVVPAQSD